MSQFVPRYYEIEQVLRARIAALDPDSPLQSDAQPCEEFGVSRMTARNAVQRLVQEGLVYRLPDRGTYVADSGAHRHASHLTNFTKEMRRRGRSPSSRLLERTLRPATELEQRRLQLAQGSSVVGVRRIRFAEASPSPSSRPRFAPTRRTLSYRRISSRGRCTTLSSRQGARPRVDGR